MNAERDTKTKEVRRIIIIVLIGIVHPSVSVRDPVKVGCYAKGHT